MQPINILLVEDDQLDVIEVRRSLDKLGILYKIDCVKNGEEALEFLSKNSSEKLKLPDVLLIDINMPKMNGIELLEKIRESAVWKHLKCFMITTSDENTDRAKANKLGVSGYIIKPLKLNSPATMDAFNLMIDLINFKSFE